MELGPDKAPAACVWVMADPRGPEEMPGEGWLAGKEGEGLPRGDMLRMSPLAVEDMEELKDCSALIEDSCMAQPR